MESIIEVKPLDNYVIWVRFSDKFDATIDIKPFITTGISAKLLDSDYFKKVKIDEFGGISWDNGFDFCPNYLRELTDSRVAQSIPNPLAQGVPNLFFNLPPK